MWPRVLACALAFGALAAPASAADRKPVPRPPDGSYFYAITLGGTQIATYETVVTGTGKPAIKSTQIFERALLGRTSATSTITFDARSLREIAYTAEIEDPSGTAAEHYDAGVRDADDAFVLTYKGVKIPVRTQPKAPLLVIDDDLGPSDLFLPAMLKASGAKVASLAFIRSGDGTVLTLLPNDDNPRPPGVPASDANMSLSYETDHTIREVYWYDPQTFVVHDLVVPGARVEVRLTAFVAPP